MNPNVSVIISTYNRSSLLPKAIDSVLSQSYTDFELIVIDDGSSDNTRDTVKAYGPRVKYFYQENAGLPAARNYAIRESKGQYFAFLDDDDLWHKDKLLLQVKKIKELPEPAFVCCNSSRDGSPIRDLSEPSGYIESMCELRMPPSCWMVSREVFNKIGVFDESYRKIGEDLAFLFRVYSHGIKIYYMNDLLVFWYTTPNSLSGSAHARIMCQERILNEFLDFIKTDRKYYFRYLCSLGKDSFRVGDKERARKYFGKAFTIKPWKMELAAKYIRSFL